jgi:integrase
MKTESVETGMAARKKRCARAGKPQRGIFEKVPGSDIWWIRFVDAQGRYRREKAGTWSNADKLLSKRKSEALQGKKLPELRKRAVSFGELADEAINYIESRYARPADDVARMKLLRGRFANRAADSVTPGEIENVLDTLSGEKDWSASTRNHHHNLLSLAYRLGILHGKARESPLRGLRRKTENNSRVRYLTSEEEKKLRAAVRSDPAWAPHEPELDLATATGLRRGSMYAATWEDVDSAARTLTIPRTKNGDPITCHSI